MVIALLFFSGLQAVFFAGFTDHYLRDALHDQIGQRALMVAKTIAATPSVKEAIRLRDTDLLQPLSMALAQTNNALFIVIGDKQGLRLAHPNQAKIGLPMEDDDGDRGKLALIDGLGYVSVDHGGLGDSVRGKAPVFDSTTGTVIGIVSVGYALQQVESTIDHYRAFLYPMLAAILLASVLAASFIAERFKRAIFGLEPDQIAALFNEREATLESVREGIIAINIDGEITTFNRPAIDTLQLDASTSLTGTHINEVLPQFELLTVLATGEPVFDQPIQVNGRELIVNKLPVRQGVDIIGGVASFRLRDELDAVSQQLLRMQQYADTLRSQTHEHANKLQTIAGLIQIKAYDQALTLIGSEVSDQQALIQVLFEAVPDPILAGCLMGKFNRAREMGLKLVIDPDSHMEDIPAELPREKLVSVLGNLIDNALEVTWKHYGEGGQIHIHMSDIGNDMIFEIEDQGSGVQEQHHHLIFERGFTDKDKAGHGIGLYLVKQFVEWWGGSVTIENIKPVGSRFTLYLSKHIDR